MEASIEINRYGTNVTNFIPVAGGAVRAISYKTVKGLCYQIKRADKYCKKYNFRTKIEFILPIVAKGGGWL